jgi:hypothetical protein
MPPDQISIITALLNVFKFLSSWPFALLLFILVIGPWVLSLLLAGMQGKRFEAVVKMYENNVKLVESYQTTAGDLKEIVVMNAQAMTRLCDSIEKNQFCPVVRQGQRDP